MSEDNVRVVVRCRPMSVMERDTSCSSVVHVDELCGTVGVQSSGVSQMNRSVGESQGITKEYRFDHVFGPASKQTDLYTKAARPIVENVLQGYNGTIFAYGQTGTGKTYTMEGEVTSPEARGIIPNSFAHIFDHIAHAEDATKFLVRVAYLEIYNEEVRDLLARDASTKLDLAERPGVGVYVKDLTNITVGGADEMDQIMSIGNVSRSVGGTAMNECSSRSHAIFSVTVECSELGKDGQQHVRVGKLHLVDLAGSERQSKTGTTGQRFKEATKINLSLSTLGNVISALVDAKSTHIPYRNSKLTRLLQDSLGGNSKTVMIANIGPADYNVDETVSTLRYASRAKQIKNQARINEDPKDALLRKFQQEIEELRRQVQNEGIDSDSDDNEAGKGNDRSPASHGVSVKGYAPSDRVRELEIEISKQRDLLNADLADSERAAITQALQDKEAMLDNARKEREAMTARLSELERKVIVGGENLLEKADHQAKLLEESRLELAKRADKEATLRQTLHLKQAERVDIEEKYSSLQDEAAGKARKLKKVWTMLQSAKAELEDVRGEQQREIEELYDNVVEQEREHALHNLIIDAYIPKPYQDLIDAHSSWNEEIGDWQLNCVAFTGGNMHSDEGDQVGALRGETPSPSTFLMQAPDFSNVYLSYADILAD